MENTLRICILILGLKGLKKASVSSTNRGEEEEANPGLLIVCKKYWEIMRNFQEVTLCSRKGLVCSKLCDFSGEDFT